VLRPQDLVYKESGNTSSEIAMGSGMFINAGPLFARAKAAYERARNTSSHDRELGQMDALDAIVFSAVALEAFINEAVELATQPPPPGTSNPPSVNSFATLLADAERSHDSITLKFMRAHHAFTGSTYDAGRAPFQDFVLLVALRDAVVHYRPQDFFNVDARGVVTLTEAKIIARPGFCSYPPLRLLDGRAKVPPRWLHRYWTSCRAVISKIRWSSFTASHSGCHEGVKLRIIQAPAEPGRDPDHLEQLGGRRGIPHSPVPIIGVERRPHLLHLQILRCCTSKPLPHKACYTYYTYYTFFLKLFPYKRLWCTPSPDAFYRQMLLAKTRCWCRTCCRPYSIRVWRCRIYFPTVL
jgi:hypothetical protein